jgi:type IV pilus assembly protein PilV
MIMKNTFLPLSAGRNQRGFSLIEVLVALLVIAFGLLGVAGMQAVSISNTSVAGLRSIAAMQASSIAAAMSSNEGYWQTPGVVSSVTVIGSSISRTRGSGGSLASSSTTCVSSSTPCTPITMAEADLTTWGNTLATVLPNGYGTINCTYTANAPVTCQVLVYWSEKTYAQNQVSGVSSSASAQYDFEMMVQP